MRRRDFTELLGGAMVFWPLAARAQAERVRRVGVLMGFAKEDEGSALRLNALRHKLEELGWKYGHNVVVHVRWATQVDEIAAMAKELVGLQPDVILALSTPIAAALQHETRSVPIVFLSVSDPIGSGFIESLAHPGGNMTGLTHFQPSIAGKWLSLLKELVPHVARLTILFNPDTTPYYLYVRYIESVAASFSIEPITAPVHDDTEIHHAITAAHGSNGGLLILPDIFNAEHRDLIISEAARYGLPAVYPFEFFARSGGLMSYGFDSIGAWGQAASYVDQILRGMRPSELPVQAPTKFQLIINLKTARALGLTIPATLIVAADEVIE